MPDKKPDLFLYPRGFMAIGDPFAKSHALNTMESVDFRFPKTLEGDEEVDTLYKLFISRSVNTNGWRFRRRVITAAARLFGDFRTWVTLQARYNEYLYDLNFDFLLDTWQFIMTGHRSMEPLTWQELLREHVDQKPGVAYSGRAGAFDFDGMKPEEVIGLWCSRENGFGDMVCTLHVLFGVAREPLAQQTKS